jgi:glyoxylase-like metal-dependent hydrolase (beta-lactamase superfamily II)
MKITFYGYNAFLVESGDKKIAIDPGALFFFWFRFTTLIPNSEWNAITHIFITHGDPDHYWCIDRVARASSASVVCNKSMLRMVNEKELMLGPRDRGLSFSLSLDHVYPNPDARAEGTNRMGGYWV